MIITEQTDGLIRHYSSLNLKIRQVETGAVYDDAWDITPCPYTYEETEEVIDGEDSEESAQEKLDILLGEEEG